MIASAASETQLLTSITSIRLSRVWWPSSYVQLDGYSPQHPPTPNYSQASPAYGFPQYGSPQVMTPQGGARDGYDYPHRTLIEGHVIYAAVG